MTQLALPQPLHFVDDLEATDLFCGAGGSAIGLHNAGFKVKIAANHWKMAVDTHADNFPDTEHDLADISQVDPRRYPSTQLLWCSPECTNHSIAKGVSKKLMRELRMLQPHEQAAGMAIPQDYKIRGSKRERTKQIGNAVTPPASELIATAIVDAVRGVERQYDAAA